MNELLHALGKLTHCRGNLWRYT